MRIAALASHGGSVLQAVLDACRTRELDGTVVLVISNNSRAGALARAVEHGIPALHLSSATHPEPAALDAAMVEALEQAGADWVLLAGYMKKLGPRVLARFRNRILNTHPALLPKYGGHGFYGRRVHEAVLAAGEHETGATVHLVDTEYDSGPILAQVRVPIRPGDAVHDVEERVKAAERKLIVATLRELAPRNVASA
ncbi:MAG: phosphoribosylglycinamide formyltransferase [Pseudomonadales bacterium]|nr:phosphoribosylglycinamide formyltransferase [Pseudomonadales bacterium]